MVCLELMLSGEFHNQFTVYKSMCVMHLRPDFLKYIAYILIYINILTNELKHVNITNSPALLRCRLAATPFLSFLTCVLIKQSEAIK